MSHLEKFNLLRSLNGPALDAIKAITDENNRKALQRLIERSDNSTLIFLKTIAALFKLQPAEKSKAIQLQGLVDKASAMYGALESLGTGSVFAQAMLIYSTTAINGTSRWISKICETGNSVRSCWKANVNIFNHATPHHKDQSIQASHLEICRMDINHRSHSLNLHGRYARQLATNCLDAQHSNR